MKELIYLLENKWIIRERDKDIYYSVKDSLKDYKELIKEKLGYQLIINADFLKLEKIPGRAEAWMGISDFNDKTDYAILCSILMFLEDKQKSDQFILSQMTDFIQANWADENNPVDWTRFDFRKRFIKVLKYCCEMNIIVVNDGEQKDFIDNKETDVLYENTGMSKFMINRLWCNVFEMNSYKDFEDSEYYFFEDKGAVRRNKIYRSLIMSPVLYKFDGNENDLIYVKNYRGTIEQDMEKYLDADLHVHKNSAMVVMPDNRAFKDVFPNNKNISDIIAQMCFLIRDKYSNESSMTVSGRINISRENFEDIVKECIKLYSDGWSKLFREMSADKITDEVKYEMKYFRMLEEDYENERVYILPLAGKIVGKYPKDYLESGENNV